MSKKGDSTQSKMRFVTWVTQPIYARRPPNSHASRKFLHSPTRENLKPGSIDDFVAHDSRVFLHNI